MAHPRIAPNGIKLVMQAPVIGGLISLCAVDRLHVSFEAS